MNLHLPQRLCRDVPAALRREWLVTNGIGGFAAGTVSGALTRRYHGLLIAALHPPVGRRLLVAKLDDAGFCGGQRFPLYVNAWKSGLEQPGGCQFLSRFDLDLGIPAWTYEFAGARLTKRIWMEAGRNVTFVRYDMSPNSPEIKLECRLLVNCRDHHHLIRGSDRVFQAQAEDWRLDVRPPDPQARFFVWVAGAAAAQARWRMDYTWCHDFHLAVEADRGYDHLESHLVLGLCQVPLRPGDTVTFVLAAERDADVDATDALARCRDRARDLLNACAGPAKRSTDAMPLPIRQLALAADQFIVARLTPQTPDGHTVIAGYPWFTDWGRDTMISLPGLTLCTGRPEVARQILLTWASYVRQGLIPNRFPDAGSEPEYHTADATLWYLWAIDQYVRATADVRTAVELWPVMKEIIAWHRRGTMHGIHVGDDGLVYTGNTGQNLTWMDAKLGDRVITPRTGKPIELSALWYDALCNLARLADLLDEPGDEYVRLATTTERSFARFWNAERSCCFDVIDAPGGHDRGLLAGGLDPAIRPNQIFAVSLTHSPLTREQQEAVVRTCEQKLLTWFGLRTLGPGESGYRGRYVGGLKARDEAYHQGTAWGWLLGPLALAHYRVHRDREAARRLLEPLLGQLWTWCIGSLAEVFDGDEPHAPGGCVAQAWSVAETLRAWCWLGQD